MKNVLKRKINSDEGFVLGVVYMMFLVIILSLAGLSINVQNNAKYTDMTVSDGMAYYYADYGLKKAQATAKTMVASATSAKKIAYANNIENLAIDLKNQFDTLFTAEIASATHLVDLTAKIHVDPLSKEQSRKYIIIVTATVRDNSRGKNVTSEARLGARMAPSMQQSDPYSGTVYIELHKVLFGATVEVKKVNDYPEY